MYVHKQQYTRPFKTGELQHWIENCKKTLKLQVVNISYVLNTHRHSNIIESNCSIKVTLNFEKIATKILKAL